MSADPGKVCAVPGCQRRLYSRNVTGVCRDHTHAQPYCACVQCCDPFRPRWRVKSREELEKEGLL